MRIGFYLAVLASFLAINCYPAAAEADLSYLAKDKNPIKVSMGNFTNMSKENIVSAEDFKKCVEESLLNRKAVKFNVVGPAEKSDITVSGIIKNYRYMERGPIKVNPGFGTMMLEMMATATQNYADMEVEFTISDSGTGKILWQETVTDYMKRTMTPAESVPMVYDKVARTFIRKSFGKPKR